MAAASSPFVTVQYINGLALTYSDSSFELLAVHDKVFSRFLCLA